ncbi:MAG: preprotein translocase subunit SecA [Gammaproteobacteria bacterium]
MSFIRKIFPSSNDRYIKRISKIVGLSNNLESYYESKSDDDLKKAYQELRDSNKSDTELKAEAFAAVREASKRALGLRHFDSQLLGGLSLAEGNIAEMKTGEGKTLVATLPAFFNFILKNKVVIVTVNDYLANRDADWMKPVYERLGMSCGVIYSNQPWDEKKNAYKCDVIYATNNELGFDYLRDNMALRSEDKLQCSLDFAIVDEVDSILIDEARTPLIISGPSSDNPEYYKDLKQIIPSLKKQLREETEEEPLQEEEKGDYLIDEKMRTVELTDNGYVKIENFLIHKGILKHDESLYTSANLKIMRYVHATLKASYLFKKDIHYIVRNGEVLLVDEHTGRAMPGRRISEGVHQALEAKENVGIQRESQTLASTTFQNFFRLFKKLSGMTGTADTEAREFQEIYGLKVVIIPTHKPMVRCDMDDVVFLTKDAKYKALISEAEKLMKQNAPVLIGTASVESSEIVSSLLKKKSINHQVLNAKQHEREAEIIANAGKPGIVTIATNMAGRGTDIVLGGKQKDQTEEEWKQNNALVLDAGGLHILGTERHESRRIDNQLRGRAGRQGDPGYSKFFLSLEDELLRLFISDSRRALFERFGMGDDHIEHKMLSRGIENAQRRIENRNFDLRKNLLEYDDVANDQRQAVYSLRDQLIFEDNISENILGLIQELLTDIVYKYFPKDSIESQWKSRELDTHLSDLFGINLSISQKIKDEKSWYVDDIISYVVQEAIKIYKEKYSILGDNIYSLERQVMLQVLDAYWKEHLAEMDHLRQSIGLRAYAQKNPKNEYKREAYEMFEFMLSRIDEETVKLLFRLQLNSEEEVKELKKRAIEEHKSSQSHSKQIHEDAKFNLMQNQNSEHMESSKEEPIRRDQPKIGRNEECHCGSGKKFKHCHGKT